MVLLNQEGNMLLPVECFVFEINKKNPVEIIAYPVEVMYKRELNGVIIGKYKTEESAKEVFINLLFSAIKMQSKRICMPKE